MSGSFTLVGTGMRGLRSRLLLTFGSVLLTAMSVAAAVVGPMYQSGAAASYLVARLQSEPNFLTGVVFDYTPEATEKHLAAARSARAATAKMLNHQFEPATVAWWSQRFTGFPGYKGEADLASAVGQCDHLRVVGRCPTKPGEVLILKRDSTYAPLAVGKTIKLKRLPIPLTVVGTYAPRDSDEDFWFNLRDLESVPPQALGSGGLTPYRPAPLLVTPETFDELRFGTWGVRATRRLVVTPRTTVDDLRSATRSVAVLKATELQQQGGVQIPGVVTVEGGNALNAVSHQVQQRRTSARSTVAPAVVSVILVALVLLLRLLSASMDLRRPELALASLRGYSRRQMWFLGLVEPMLMLAIATPVGVLAGYLAARALGTTWLVPGLPMPFVLGSAVAVVGVVGVCAAVAALVVRGALDEPLSAQIAGVRRPGRSGRWAILLQLALVAAAVAVLVATLASGHKSRPDATDLALPILLAVAAGLLTTIGVQWLARAWARWTTRRRGLYSYVASRTVSRRREGTLVVLPLTAALAVAVFAAGVFTAAADWRASTAATEVGADLSYSTKLNMDQAVALTHRIDPDGRWLMAVAAEYEGASQTLVMDTPRLARVGVWPASWTPAMSASEVQDRLGLHRPSVVLQGSRLAVTMDNQVQGDYPSLTATFTLAKPDGSTASVLLGPYPTGTSTVSTRLDGCETGCVVKQLSFGGPAGFTEAMRGRATLRSVTVDGEPVTAATQLDWRVATPLLNTPVGVSRAPRLVPDGVQIDFASRSADSFAAITPDDVPQVRPVLLGQRARPDVARRLGDVLRLHTQAFHPLDVRSIGTARSMPVLGPAGMLIDYTMLTRDVGVDDAAAFVTILARGDTPPAIRSALADSGISQPTTLQQTRTVLDQDAFALALNLYLVVTVIVILLALAGLGANLAVQLPARRRDAASLRVVGVRRRSIMAAVVAEFLVVLGAAALAGVAAGALAQYVVVRTVTLGYADTQHTPQLLPSLDLAGVGQLLAIVTAVLVLVAVGVAGLTVRGARTASLRENAR